MFTVILRYVVIVLFGCIQRVPTVYIHDGELKPPRAA